MIAALAVALLAQAAQPAAMADARMGRMVALYDEVCLKTFPNDAAIDALMKAKGATAMAAEEVRVTMNDDPGRGWFVQDGDQAVRIFLELPPYHACSVRWNASKEAPDLAAYRAVTDRFMATAQGWATMPPMSMDRGDIHISGTGAPRTLPSGGRESLFVIDQTINDAKRRAAGETGVVRRFVHQIKEG